MLRSRSQINKIAEPGIPSRHAMHRHPQNFCTVRSVASRNGQKSKCAVRREQERRVVDCPNVRSPAPEDRIARSAVSSALRQSPRRFAPTGGSGEIRDPRQVMREEVRDLLPPSCSSKKPRGGHSSRGPGRWSGAGEVFCFRGRVVDQRVRAQRSQRSRRRSQRSRRRPGRGGPVQERRSELETDLAQRYEETISQCAG